MGSPHNPRRQARARLIAIVSLAALFVATAAEGFRAGAISLSNGKLGGIVSGIVLFGLVTYVIWLYAEPLLAARTSGLGRALLILLVVGIVKTALLPLFPGFGPDIASYQAWAGRIASLGPAFTYHSGFFIDYPPGYLYALWAAGAIVKLFGASGSVARMIVEGPAMVADFLLAAMVFVYLRHFGRRFGAYFGMLLVALNPAMLFDTVVWGQSDSVLTLVMLLSVLMALEDEYELAWGLAAIAVLVKPQALSFLPVLGLWTLLKTGWPRWWRAALAFLAVALAGLAPFQINQPWDWIFSLYAKAAAYYHETSVNAFNFMALIGGLRQADTMTILGLPLFDVGMALLVPLYLFVAWTLWRHPDRRNLFYAVFLTIFGFFMFAPRMHERYLYPALAFAAPLAVEETAMLLVLGVLTLTSLFNLVYVKHTLETIVFLKSRDGLAMLTAAVNLIAFAWAVRLGHAPAATPEDLAVAERGLGPMFTAFRSSGATESQASVEESAPAPLSWLRIDTLVIVALLACAAAVRFWRLGHPGEIVFDEVHFVTQARHYLHSEPFLDPHPPLAKLVIALGVWLFGDHPWSWRFGNAVIGTALVGVTYLLGRRMFRARLAATLAALFITCDGMFLVDSRVAVIDIVYITFAAVAYLFFFRFVDLAGAPACQRRALVWIGVALGLCLGSKLYIPAVTFVLVVGFLIYVLWKAPGTGLPSDPMRLKRVTGAVGLVGATSAGLYLATFMPHYILGWWGGIADLFHYYGDVIWYENSVAAATHPYSSPWWSWPLMLRPIAYWQHFPKTGKVATIWGGGNPVLWWGALTAITITAARALERRSLVNSFLVIGYLSYLVIWIPIGRTTFLYHYMGSVYLAYLALGALLADCWYGRARVVEQLALLLTLLPPFVLGVGAAVGASGFLALGIAYTAVLERPRWPGRLICAAFVALVLGAAAYFFPLWVAMPIERAGYYARMWFSGPGLRNWI